MTLVRTLIWNIFVIPTGDVGPVISAICQCVGFILGVVFQSSSQFVQYDFSVNCLRSIPGVFHCGSSRPDMVLMTGSWCVGDDCFVYGVACQLASFTHSGLCNLLFALFIFKQVRYTICWSLLMFIITVVYIITRCLCSTTRAGTLPGRIAQISLFCADVP